MLKEEKKHKKIKPQRQKYCEKKKRQSTKTRQIEAEQLLPNSGRK